MHERFSSRSSEKTNEAGAHRGALWPGGWRIGDPSHLDLGGAGHAMMISLGK